MAHDRTDRSGCSDRRKLGRGSGRARRRGPGAQFDRPRHRLPEARAIAARQLERDGRVHRRRHRPGDAIAPERWRPGRRPDDRAGAGILARAATRTDLRRFAADDGLRGRRAEEGHAAHRPQRSLARIEAGHRGRSQGRVVLSRAGRRQQQLAIRGACPLRCPTRRRKGKTTNLAARGRLLAELAERRRLLGLCAGRRGLGKHDLCRHRGAGDVDRRARIGRRDGRARTRHLLPAPSGGPRAGASRRLARLTFFGKSQSASGRLRPELPLLLSLRNRAGRPAHRAQVHRRSRLVSRGGRVFGPRSGPTLALLERLVARRAARTHQHGARTIVSRQGAAARRDGQTRIWPARTLGPTSPRRRQPGRLHRREMESRAHLAIGKCRTGYRRGPAAVAGALHQRQPRDRAVALCGQTPRLRRSRRVHLRRGLLRRLAPLRRELSGN